MTAGRPRAFATVEKLQTGIDKYVAEEVANDDPITVSGLAYALGIDRRTLLRYRAEDNEFCPTIKRAIARIEADKVKNAMKGKYDKTICIFDLKNNHGWKDERHINEKSQRRTEIIVDKDEMKDAFAAAIEILKS